MRHALELGYDRLEIALIAASNPASYADDGWSQADLLPIPPMTAYQAIQLLCLHEKSVRQGWQRPHRRRRRGESEEAHIERLRAMWTAEKDCEAEDAALRRAERYETSGSWRFEDEPEPPSLPPLHLVTGWSKARPEPPEGEEPKKQPHNPNKALFGGWRISDWKKREGRG